jgi:hypothetical protein
MAFITTANSAAQVLRNLSAQNLRLEAACARGLKKAGLHLQRASQLLVPVEYGVLKASAFTRASGQGTRTVVEVGYTAAYAIYVHEAIAMKLKGQPRKSGLGNYWDPPGRGQAKFLEAPFRSKRDDLRAIVAAEMAI